MTVMVYTSAFRMTLAQFEEIVASAVDESTIISYWTPDDGTRQNSETKVLLEMVAGASSSSSEHCPESTSGKVADNLFFDEERNPRIDDGIKKLLADEVVIGSFCKYTVKIQQKRGETAVPHVFFSFFQAYAWAAHTYSEVPYREESILLFGHKADENCSCAF